MLREKAYSWILAEIIGQSACQVVEIFFAIAANGNLFAQKLGCFADFGFAANIAFFERAAGSKNGECRNGNKDSC